jgi:hypothetical protein
MRSDAKKTFYYHADANALGGFIEKPFPRIIPSQASVSLPVVGGLARTRTEAFNFEEIVSCRSAYTRVSGSQIAQNGPWSMTVTSVVEGLNILEVITAERLVAQVSVEYPRDGGYLEVSLAGSSFDGLRLGGCNASPALNATLLCGAERPIALPVFQETGREQAGRIISSAEKYGDRDDTRWIFERFGWMDADRELDKDGCVLCSLVDGVDRAIPGRSFGHVVEIPDFGRIFLGELLACRHSIQLSLIRTELGCGTTGQTSGPTAAVRGVPVPP